MIKFGGPAGEHGERKILGIALGNENIKRLVAGEPISFQAEELGIPNVNVIIIAGETAERAMELMKTVARSQGVAVGVHGPD